MDKKYKKKTIFWLCFFVVSWVLIMVALNVLQITFPLNLKQGINIVLLLLGVYFIPMTFFIGQHAKNAKMTSLSFILVVVRVIGVIIFLLFLFSIGTLNK